MTTTITTRQNQANEYMKLVWMQSELEITNDETSSMLLEALKLLFIQAAHFALSEED